MTQLVLTGHTGQNLRYPISKLVKFIVKQKQHKGKAPKAVERDLSGILLPHQPAGGFILLSLDARSELNGILAMLPGYEDEPSEIGYLATTPDDASETRQQLLRNALKISRGSISVSCTLQGEDLQWLQGMGYHFQQDQQLIKR